MRSPATAVWIGSGRSVALRGRVPHRLAGPRTVRRRHGTRAPRRRLAARCPPPHRSTPRPIPPRPRRPMAARRAISRSRPTNLRPVARTPMSPFSRTRPGCDDTQASLRLVGRARRLRGGRTAAVAGAVPAHCWESGSTALPEIALDQDVGVSGRRSDTRTISLHEVPLPERLRQSATIPSALQQRRGGLRVLTDSRGRHESPPEGAHDVPGDHPTTDPVGMTGAVSTSPLKSSTWAVRSTTVRSACGDGGGDGSRGRVSGQHRPGRRGRRCTTHGQPHGPALPGRAHPRRVDDRRKARYRRRAQSRRSNDRRRPPRPCRLRATSARRSKTGGD